MTVTIERWNGVLYEPLDLDDYDVDKVVRANVSPPKVTPVTVAPVRALSESYVRTDVQNGELDLQMVVKSSAGHFDMVRKLQAALKRFKAVFSDDPGYTYTLTQTDASKQPVSRKTAILTLHCTYEVTAPVTTVKTWSCVQRIAEYVDIESGKETFLTFLITTGTVTGDLTVNGVYIETPPSNTTFEISKDALLAGNDVGAVYTSIPTGAGKTYIDIYGSDGVSFCTGIILQCRPKW